MVPIVNMIREVIIEFMRESFPAYGIKDIAVVMFLSALQTRGAKSWTDGRVVPRGRPRYVNGMEPTVEPNRSASSLHLSGGVLIGTIVDLWKLILSPMDVA